VDDISTQLGGPAVNGQTRRRERTHRALLQAGADLLAEGRTNASIEEITQRAGVGFGSFRNHFDTKEKLFQEAVFGLLDGYVAWLLEAVAHLTDPAEIFACSSRLTGRLAGRRPDLFAPLLVAGMDVLFMDRALRAAALADIQAGIASGRFVDEDPEILIVAVGGALLGLLRLVSGDRNRDADRATDVMTTRLLCLLGLTAGAARTVVARPLPEVPGPTHWTRLH
jgi:AcrR family transcriptional regulator